MEKVPPVEESKSCDRAEGVRQFLHTGHLMEFGWPVSAATATVDDDLIEYSVKRWAPFICRLNRRIVAVSTDDVLREYARRLDRPVADIVDRYRQIQNDRRRHRPKRGLSMIWNAATNRPHVLFYWTNGRAHFWCCDPLQLCPARFLGDIRLPSKDTVEDLIDYLLNVLSFFDPSPVIVGARHRVPRLDPVMITADIDDDDVGSSSSPDVMWKPLSSTTSSPITSTIDDPIIPYRPDESSDISLSESESRQSLPPPLPPPQEIATAARMTPVAIQSKRVTMNIDHADIDHVINSMQEVLTDGHLMQTVETVRHRSVFSPMTSLYSPLIPNNITFPANVRPAPIIFDIPRPVRPIRAHAATQTEPDDPDSPSSVVVAPTQQDMTAQNSIMDDTATAERPSLLGDDVTLLDVQQWITQLDDATSSSPTPMSYWCQQFPFILHFCRKAAELFESRSLFQSYIRFDYDDAAVAGSSRRVVANAMSKLAPSVLIQWICTRSLIEAPFVSNSVEQYALVPFDAGRGVCLCMNQAAWLGFGFAALQETKRRKPSVLSGPIETAHAWISISKRFVRSDQSSYAIEQFHDDILDAITDEDTLPDNSALVLSPPVQSTSEKGGVARQPLSDVSNNGTPPGPDQPAAAESQSQALGCHAAAESQALSIDGPTQTLDYLLENIASQIPIS